MKIKKGKGVSGSKSWSNKEKVVECGGQSVIQAVLETNHARSCGRGGLCFWFCFAFFFFLRALVQFWHYCTRNQILNFQTQTKKKNKQQTQPNPKQNNPKQRNPAQNQNQLKKNQNQPNPNQTKRIQLKGSKIEPKDFS